MTIATRQPKADEIPELRRIWKTVFGDSDRELDIYFKTYFDPQMTVAIDAGAGLAAAGYIFPVGELLCEGAMLPCAMIFAIAALPEYRNRGFGKAVVNELISKGHAIGCKAVVLHPSEDSLFEFYSTRTPLRDWFYSDELIYSKDTFSNEKETKLTAITTKEYILLRKGLLSGIPHIDFDLRAISYQESLCLQFGGGLYRAETSCGAACAIVEKQSDGSVSVKELLTPQVNNNEVLSAIASEFPAPEYLVRSPVTLSSPSPGKRRFGMLAIDTENELPVFNIQQFVSNGTIAPHYGPAFD